MSFATDLQSELQEAVDGMVDAQFADDMEDDERRELVADFIETILPAIAALAEALEDETVETAE